MMNFSFIKPGTHTFINATGGNNGQLPTQISSCDVDQVLDILYQNNKDLFAGESLSNRWFGIVPYEVVPSLINMHGFQHFPVVAKMPGSDELFLGMYQNVHFYTSHYWASIPGIPEGRHAIAYPCQFFIELNEEETGNQRSEIIELRVTIY